MARDKVEENSSEEVPIGKAFLKFATAIEDFIQGSEKNLRRLEALELQYPQFFANKPQSTSSSEESGGQNSCAMKNE